MTWNDNYFYTFFGREELEAMQEESERKKKVEDKWKSVRKSCVTQDEGIKVEINFAPKQEIETVEALPTQNTTKPDPVKVKALADACNYINNNFGKCR